MTNNTQKIITYLWFDGQAEEAVNLYKSVFKEVNIGHVYRYDEATAKVSGRPEGSAMTIEFELFEHKFVALNGGPQYQFTPAISFLVNCETQEEIDHYWTQLSADPQAEQCGWLVDKFGLSWQIVPTILFELLGDVDRQKEESVTEAMLKMKKIEIAGLKAAYENG